VFRKIALDAGGGGAWLKCAFAVSRRDATVLSALAERRLAKPQARTERYGSLSPSGWEKIFMRWLVALVAALFSGGRVQLRMRRLADEPLSGPRLRRAAADIQGPKRPQHDQDGKSTRRTGPRSAGSTLGTCSASSAAAAPGPAASSSR
jgi:hypothetical protein